MILSVILLSGCGNPEKKISRTDIMQTNAFNITGDIVISCGEKETDGFTSEGFNVNIDVNNNTAGNLTTKGTIMKNHFNELVPYMDFVSSKSVLYFSSHDVPERLFTEKQLNYIETAAQNYIQVDLLHTQNQVFNPDEETADVAAAARFIFTNFIMLKNDKNIPVAYNEEKNSETYMLSSANLSEPLDELSQTFLIYFDDSSSANTEETNTNKEENIDIGPEEFHDIWKKAAEYWIENSTTYNKEETSTENENDLNSRFFDISISIIHREKDINVIIDGKIATDIVRNVEANLILSSIEPFEITIPEKFTTHENFIAAMELCSIPENLQIPISNPDPDDIAALLNRIKNSGSGDQNAEKIEVDTIEE